MLVLSQQKFRRRRLIVDKRGVLWYYSTHSSSFCEILSCQYQEEPKIHLSSNRRWLVSDTHETTDIAVIFDVVSLS